MTDSSSSRFDSSHLGFFGLTILGAAFVLGACDATPDLPALDAGTTTTDGLPVPLDGSPPPVLVDAPSPPPQPPPQPGTCNTLEVDGAWMAMVRVASAPPAMTGGTLVEGTYELVDWKSYTGTGGPSGPGGLSLKQTVRFETGTFSHVTEVLSPSQVQRGSSTYSTSAENVTFVSTCTTSFGGTSMMKYTASPTGLMLLSMQGEWFAFTKL